jgi:hypothetical protein
MTNIVLTGKSSNFGGPEDTGVKANEGLALCSPKEVGKFPGLFLAEQPPGTTGLARRLDPTTYYIACRWDYSKTPKEYLQETKVDVAANGRSIKVQPIDDGPGTQTGRVADLSPGGAEALGVQTDDVVTVTIPLPDPNVAKTEAPSIVPASGHVHAMPQTEADLDRVYGKFTWSEGSPRGAVNVDHAWIAANIVEADIPQLHKFTGGKPIECHKDIAGPLKAVFTDIEAKGLLDRILSYDGLWVTRHKNWDPSRSLSLHSWGTAIDINADWNPYGGTPAPAGAKGSCVELIPSFEAQGFAWGGYFGGGHASDTDGMHFEYANPVTVSPIVKAPPMIDVTPVPTQVDLTVLQTQIDTMLQQSLSKLLPQIIAQVTAGTKHPAPSTPSVVSVPSQPDVITLPAGAHLHVIAEG